MKIAHHNTNKVTGRVRELDSYHGSDMGQKFLPSRAEDRPYDWSGEEDWSDGKPEARATVVIDSTPLPLTTEERSQGTVNVQRCLKALRYSRALASTFVEVIKEAYMPTDQLAEIRRLSEEEGVSTVVHIKW